MIYKNHIGEPHIGTVILIHGQGEHSGRYTKLIQLLGNQGYAVHYFDWPGHGQSRGKKGHTSIEEGVEIVENIVNKLSSKPFLFGHSMGGLTAIRYSEIFEEKIRGIILSSPELSFDNRIPPMYHHISRLLNIFLPKKTTYNRIRPEELSRNHEAVKKYIQDSFIHDRITLSSHHSIYHNMKKAFQESRKITCPVLILIGTNDKIVPNSKTKDFFNQLPIKDKTLLEFQGAYHEIFEDPEWGESFHKKILSWINNY